MNTRVRKWCWLAFGGLFVCCAFCWLLDNPLMWWVIDWLESDVDLISLAPEG